MCFSKNTPVIKVIVDDNNSKLSTQFMSKVLKLKRVSLLNLERVSEKILTFMFFRILNSHQFFGLQRMHVTFFTIQLCLEFFWSVFSHIRNKILRISPYSVRMRENTDQEKPHIWTLFMQ